jgi:uncharacterized protein YjbJ (UPF0337 family)
MVMGAKSDQVKGKAKEIVGATLGDEDLEAEGTADRTAGEMKEKVGKVEDKVEGVIDQAKDSLRRK